MLSKTTLVGISGKMRHGKDETCRLFIEASSTFSDVKIMRRSFADPLKEECADFMLHLINAWTEDGIPLDGSTLAGYVAVANFIDSLFPLETTICDTNDADILLDWYLNDLPMYIRQFGLQPTTRSILVPANQGWIDTFNNPATKPLFRKLLQWWGTNYRRNLCSNDYWLDKMAEFLLAQEPGTIVVAPDTRFINEAEFCKSHDGFLIRVWRPGQDDSSQHPSEIMLDDYKDFNLIIENSGTVDDLSKAVYHAFRLFLQWQDNPWQDNGLISLLPLLWRGPMAK